jgi:hypothetical protein
MKDIINSIREDHVHEEESYSGSSDSDPSDDDLPQDEQDRLREEILEALDHFAQLSSKTKKGKVIGQV